MLPRTESIAFFYKWKYSWLTTDSISNISCPKYVNAVTFFTEFPDAFYYIAPSCQDVQLCC